MIASEIGAALKGRLSTLTFSPPIGVAAPNRDYVPDGKRHIAVEILHAPNDRLTLSGNHRHSGTCVVTVAIPTGGGSGEADGIADAVAAHFPCDLAMPLPGGGAVRVTAAPSVRGGFRDGPFWRTPVAIPFEVLK